MQTHELCARIADDQEGIGKARFATATGRNQRTIEYWTHDPMSADDPLGHPNIFDWIEAVLEALAARPHARPLLHLVEMWFKRLFDRLLRRVERTPTTEPEVLARLATAAREHGDAAAVVIDGLKDGKLSAAELDRAIEEMTQARFADDQLLEGLEALRDQRQVRPLVTRPRAS